MICPHSPTHRGGTRKGCLYAAGEKAISETHTAALAFVTLSLLGTQSHLYSNHSHLFVNCFYPVTVKLLFVT